MPLSATDILSDSFPIDVRDGSAAPRTVRIDKGGRKAVIARWMNEDAGVPTPTPVPVPPPIDVGTSPPGNRVMLVPDGNWQAAARSAKAGTVLLLQPGATYRGTLALPAANGLWVGPSGGGPMPLVLAPKGQHGVTLNGDCRYVRIGGFRVEQEGRDLDAGAPTNSEGGHGLRIIGRIAGLTLENLLVRWFEHNIAIQKAGDVTLRDVRSLDCWGTGSEDAYHAQGLYTSEIWGSLTLDRCVFDRCGTHPRLAGVERPNQYKHCVYVQHDCCPAMVSGCLFSRPASIGLMLRGGGTVTDCFAHDCSIAFLGFGASLSLRGCGIYGGHRHWTPKSEAWVGNAAVYSYAERLLIDNTAIVGAPAQASPQSPKSFDAGCITLSSNYEKPSWAARDPQAVIGGNVTVRAWPLALDKQNHQPAVCMRDGRSVGNPVRQLPGGPLKWDWQSVVNRARAGQWDAASAVGSLR